MATRHWVTQSGVGVMIAATVTSMVPQGLVLMATLALTLGAVRLGGRGAVVQRLSAVESMASVNMLCLDKTGTLTTNRLGLERIVKLDKTISEEEIRSRLRTFALVSTDHQNRSIQAIRSGLGRSVAPPTVIDQLPFKSQNRYSAVRVRLGDRENLLVLGAWEALRPFLEPPAIQAGEPPWQELLRTGLRLLLFAEAAMAEDVRRLPPLRGALPPVTLRPLALLAFHDELRPHVQDVLEDLTRQGISAKIVSGDHPETVRCTLASLHFADSRCEVVAGEDLARAPDPASFIEAHNVYGRVAPRQKVEIVTALQSRGHHVAMIGDGVNDLLAIKKADLGIALGEGSPAARTVAGLVLENNNFDLLPATLEEGRIILRNLRQAAKLFLVKNVFTLFLIIACLGVFKLDFPYLPQQVTLLNWLVIGIPAFVIALSRERSTSATKPHFLREVGSVFWFIMNTLQESMERVQQGRAPFRAASFFRESVRAVVDSVPLVGLVCFFLGLTMALLTGYQLQRFGTERLIPGLVAIAFTRELGPLLTGIMVAARIGAAFTAELGTMQVNEEVEAVEAMGIGPLRFLAAPRMLALFLLAPCLSTVSNLAAVFASSLVCKVYFSIAFPYFLDLVKDSLLIRDIITGILKSFMFGLLIAAIACYRGLTVKGGAAGVGTNTTSSVVTAITTVIGFDTVYNVIYTNFYPT